jgi:hypothetical protein
LRLWVPEYVNMCILDMYIWFGLSMTHTCPLVFHSDGAPQWRAPSPHVRPGYQACPFVLLSVGLCSPQQHAYPRLLARGCPVAVCGAWWGAGLGFPSVRTSVSTPVRAGAPAQGRNSWNMLGCPRRMASTPSSYRPGRMGARAVSAELHQVVESCHEVPVATVVASLCALRALRWRPYKTRPMATPTPRPKAAATGMPGRSRSRRASGMGCRNSSTCQP